MDEHFRSAPWERNLPVLMGLLGVWNINFLELPTLAVLPYDGRLEAFPRLPAAARHGEQRQVNARVAESDRVGDSSKAPCPTTSSTETRERTQSRWSPSMFAT